MRNAVRNSALAALSMLDLESPMAFPREHLQFAMWYLRGRRYITQDDRSSFVMTAEGEDYLETQLPTSDILYKIFRAAESGVMVLPKGLLSLKNR